MPPKIFPSKCKAIHLLTTLRWFDPFSPISLIIGYGFGITYYEIFLLQAIFSITNLISELPAGMIADRYGRSYVISLSGIFLSIAYLLFLTFPSFFGWTIAEIFAGIGVAFYSGADTALLYETCQKYGRDFYHKQEGLMQGFARLSEGLSSGLGFIAILNPRMPIALAFAAKVFLTLLCWTNLSSKNNTPRKKLTWNQHTAQISASDFFTTFHNNKLKRPQQHKILTTTFFYAATQSIVLINIFWLIQVTASKYALSLISTSMIWVLYFTLCGMTSYLLSNRLRNYWRAQIIGLPVVSCILLCMALSISIMYRWMPLVLFSLIYGLSMPLINGLINRHSTHEQRVVMHSINTTLTRLLFVLVVPFVGYLVDYVSSEAAFICLFLISLVTFLLSIRLVTIIKR